MVFKSRENRENVEKIIESRLSNHSERILRESLEAQGIDFVEKSTAVPAVAVPAPNDERSSQSWTDLALAQFIGAQSN